MAGVKISELLATSPAAALSAADGFEVTQGGVSKGALASQLATFASSNLSLPNGSAAAPALSFANSPTTGFYRAGVDQLGMAIGGSNLITASSTGVALSGALGAAADGRATEFTATGSGSGANSLATNLSSMLVTGGNVLQVRTYYGQMNVRPDVGSTATFAITNDAFVRLGFASGTPAFATGDINQAYVFRGHIANESLGGTIDIGATFHSAPFDFEDGNGATGTFGETMGLFVRDVGHATKVTTSAHGVLVTDMTGGAPVTVAYGSQMVAGTGKYFLRSTGNAPSSHFGALRVGFVGAPGTPVFDGQYQPGTLPSGITLASQFYSEFTDAHSDGTSVLVNVLNRINASGTNNVTTFRALQTQVDIANTAGTITTANGLTSVVNVIPASGTLAITSARSIIGSFAFTGTGGTTTTASYFHVGAPNFTTGTHAVTTIKGFNIDDIGHATRVTNAIGVDIANITASATLTVGIRSAMASATGKWFMLHSGTADSAHVGNLRIGASTAPSVALDVSGAITASGLVLTAASATGAAGLRLPHGAAPTSPVNGDIWTTTAGLFVRINGATVGPLT